MGKSVIVTAEQRSSLSETFEGQLNFELIIDAYNRARFQGRKTGEEVELGRKSDTCMSVCVTNIFVALKTSRLIT